MNIRKKGMYELLLEKGVGLLDVSAKGEWNDMVVFAQWCIMESQIPNGVEEVGMQYRWKWE
jgi:hypothetical protein